MPWNLNIFASPTHPKAPDVLTPKKNYRGKFEYSAIDFWPPHQNVRSLPQFIPYSAWYHLLNPNPSAPNSGVNYKGPGNRSYSTPLIRIKPVIMRTEQKESLHPKPKTRGVETSEMFGWGCHKCADFRAVNNFCGYVFLQGSVFYAKSIISARAQKGQNANSPSRQIPQPTMKKFKKSTRPQN